MHIYAVAMQAYNQLASEHEIVMGFLMADTEGEAEQKAMERAKQQMPEYPGYYDGQVYFWHKVAVSRLPAWVNAIGHSGEWERYMVKVWCDGSGEGYDETPEQFAGRVPGVSIYA